MGWAPAGSLPGLEEAGKVRLKMGDLEEVGRDCYKQQREVRSREDARPGLGVSEGRDCAWGT